MTLRGKYGLSKFLHTYNEYLFMFYMFDPVAAAVFRILGIFEKGFEDIKDWHITVKLLIVLVMATESLMSHNWGPGRIISKKRKNAAELVKGPFRINSQGCACAGDHGHSHSHSHSHG